MENRVLKLIIITVTPGDHYHKAKKKAWNMALRDHLCILLK
jgi:hypothetical protein